jgi:NAD(P) transhydrogenase
VRVSLVDRYPKPLGFLDDDLATAFLEAFERQGGTFIGEADVVDVAFDGVSAVATRFAEGTVLKSDKVLCALGRVAQTSGLKLDNAGITVSEAGLIEVNEDGRTAVAHVYAAGDAIGPPSLASASMEQGRRAACAMFGLPLGSQGNYIPTGIYAIPELASVGLTERQARAGHDAVLVGCARFAEIARGHIAGISDGMLKLICDGEGRLLGAHIIGAEATDLIHIGQMALIQQAGIDVFIDNVFNFPTYAECYRVAALQVAGQLRAAEPEERGSDRVA